MNPFEQKYLELLTATANMRKVQKSKERCNDSQTRTKCKAAESKVDAIIQGEVGKSIQIIEATKTLFS